MRNVFFDDSDAGFVKGCVCGRPDGFATGFPPVSGYGGVAIMSGVGSVSVFAAGSLDKFSRSLFLS